MKGKVNNHASSAILLVCNVKDFLPMIVLNAIMFNIFYIEYMLILLKYFSIVKVLAQNFFFLQIVMISLIMKLIVNIILIFKRCVHNVIRVIAGHVLDDKKINVYHVFHINIF